MSKPLTAFFLSFLLLSVHIATYGTVLRESRLCGDAECEKIKYIVPHVRMSLYDTDPEIRAKLEGGLRQALADVNKKWGGKYNLSLEEYEKENPTPRGEVFLKSADQGGLVVLTMNAKHMELDGRQYVAIAFYLNRGKLEYNQTMLAFYPAIIDLEEDITSQISKSLECNLSVHFSSSYYRSQAIGGSRAKQWREKCK